MAAAVEGPASGKVDLLPFPEVTACREFNLRGRSIEGVLNNTGCAPFVNEPQPTHDQLVGLSTRDTFRPSSSPPRSPPPSPLRPLLSNHCPSLASLGWGGTSTSLDRKGDIMDPSAAPLPPSPPSKNTRSRTDPIPSLRQKHRVRHIKRRDRWLRSTRGFQDVWRSGGSIHRAPLLFSSLTPPGQPPASPHSLLELDQPLWEVLPPQPEEWME